jgi:DNA-binding MarR family transcriptional regulator
MAADDPATLAWRAMCALVLDHDRRQAVADALDLSFGRIKLLRRLSGGPATLRELAARLGVDPPYVTVMVDDLERRGLVERAPHPTDRRAKIVELTASGRRAVKRAERALDEPPAALRALDPADLERLTELLSPIHRGAT